MTDQATAAVSVGAVASPVWLPWLSTASEIAAIFAPILGAIWLVVQIYGKLVDIRIKRKRSNEEQ